MRKLEATGWRTSPTICSLYFLIPLKKLYLNAVENIKVKSMSHYGEHFICWKTLHFVVFRFLSL